ncbi:MAG TPA: hypothetical protein VK273_05015 [Gaiellaceae bacterium]|nr:hypothetical protein [Gaiellaceae bacterium]
MRPLLCELHAHTAWSDGELSLGAVVDLYGRAGFDVLCITEATIRGRFDTGGRASMPRMWTLT